MPRSQVATIIVNRNRPDLTDELVEQVKHFGKTRGSDIFVIDCGSDPDKRSQYTSHHFSDPGFRGKCYGHNRGLRYLLGNSGRYPYYWFLMNDLVFQPVPDPIDTMVDVLESEPRMGILSPTERHGGYPGSRPEPGARWHKVATCNYLALMMKDECLQEVGFLNPEFKYSWGAIHELSYKMYRTGWFLAYSDEVTMDHLGGTTYGSAANTIPRHQYLRNAKRWAAEYFRSTYGEDWDEKFGHYLPRDVAVNTYTLHRAYWEADSPNSRAVYETRHFVRRTKRFLRALLVGQAK